MTDGNKEPGPTSGDLSGLPQIRRMELMLSGLAAKHLGMPVSRLPQVGDFGGTGSWLAHWRCEFIGTTDNDTAYFLLTNARTLYSLVVPNTDGRIETLCRKFIDMLDRHIEAAGYGAWFQAGGKFGVVRGRPRSLIGSQNELVRCALVRFERPGTLEAMIAALNRTPMLKLPEIFPEDAFQKLLASDPPAATPAAGKVVPFPRPDRT